MLNFSEEIKNEIINGRSESEGEALALLSAFIKSGGGVIFREGQAGLYVITENERTAEFINDLASRFQVALTVASAGADSKRGRDKFIFESFTKKAVELLKRAAIYDGQSLIEGIDDKILADDECKIAYLKGAFLGGGSCTLPSDETDAHTGYHFETVFSDYPDASDFCALLCEFDILAKLVARKDDWVVYIKRKEIISDLLNVISATRSAEKLDALAQERQENNNQNRQSNCMASNLDRTAIAAVAQINAINLIAKIAGLKSLSSDLFEVAIARISDQTASMQELASSLGITKSCINHRIRKIMGIAKALSAE